MVQKICAGDNLHQCLRKRDIVKKVKLEKREIRKKEITQKKKKKKNAMKDREEIAQKRKVEDEICVANKSCKCLHKLLWHKMTKILSDKYPLLLILHLARLSSSCDLVMCTYTSHPPLWKEPKLDLKDF